MRFRKWGSGCTGDSVLLFAMTNQDEDDELRVKKEDESEIAVTFLRSEMSIPQQDLR